jgi:hypothetical protein
MGLPWVRLDTTFFDHPKVLGLVAEGQYRPIVLYLSSMTYAGKHGTDGFIPREALMILHGRKPDADKLVQAQLWHENAGGWDINGWDEYQVSDDEAKKRREKAKNAAAIRWSKKVVRGAG